MWSEGLLAEHSRCASHLRDPPGPARPRPAPPGRGLPGGSGQRFRAHACCKVS